jgi:hypothetical protein
MLNIWGRIRFDIESLRYKVINFVSKSKLNTTLDNICFDIEPQKTLDQHFVFISNTK